MVQIQRETYSVKETALIWGISTITMYRLLNRGQVPHRRVGGRILIDRETIENFGKVEGERS